MPSVTLRPALPRARAAPRLRVRLDGSHIAAGRPTADSMPIVLAVADALPGSRPYLAHASVIVRHPDTERCEQYHLQGPAYQVLEAYRRGEDIQPQTLDLGRPILRWRERAA